MEFIAVAFGVSMMIFTVALTKRMFSVPAPGSKRVTVVQQVASADRQKALQVYESLCREKLEVIKTALAMGYSHEDLARLDARLESLIGRDQLERLARGEAPIASGDLLMTDLGEEARRIKEIRTAR